MCRPPQRFAGVPLEGQLGATPGARRARHSRTRGRGGGTPRLGRSREPIRPRLESRAALFAQRDGLSRPPRPVTFRPPQQQHPASVVSQNGTLKPFGLPLLSTWDQRPRRTTLTRPWQAQTQLDRAGERRADVPGSQRPRSAINPELLEASSPKEDAAALSYSPQVTIEFSSDRRQVRVAVQSARQACPGVALACSG